MLGYRTLFLVGVDHAGISTQLMVTRQLKKEEHKEGGAAFDYFFRPIKPERDQGGEMIYWERPEGGRVFHAGSIASGRALHGDKKFQALFRNALDRFGVRPSQKT